MWVQREIRLQARPRGFHLITDEIDHQLPDVRLFKVGLLSLFIQHTSASLTLNENADPTVRQDFEAHFNHLVPEEQPYFSHTCEGPDDMPAHLKSSLLGNHLTIPISHGVLALGVWQGIYLCEHRNEADGRHLIATICGDSR